MVLYDDKKWMCRLIRTAFVLEDDSGICENVLKQKPYLGETEEHDSDSFTSSDSFDIRDVGDSSHRRRSNTAIRLEKLEKQRKAHTDTQVVRVNPAEVVKNDLVFEKVTDYSKPKPDASSKVVSVSKLLQSVPHPSRVPFASYARFEATCQPSSACKKIAIFCPFLPPQHANYPIRVSVLATAKVIDLIGLTLWLTSQAHPNVELGPITSYHLLIADEDGECESGFPPLETTEVVSKFSFHYLALVPASSKSDRTDGNGAKSNGLTFLLPNGHYFHMGVTDYDMTVGKLINQVLVASGWQATSKIQSSTVGYHLEKLMDPSVTFTDMSVSWPQLKCKEFCLVRDGAKSVQDNSGNLDPTGSKGNTGTSSSRSSLYPVMVSTGRFNRVKRAFCVLWSGDRMDLEFEHKLKSYPLVSITAVKYDAAKMRVIVSLNLSSNPSISLSSHYLSNSNNITMTANDPSTASTLYHHLCSMLLTKKEIKHMRI